MESFNNFIAESFDPKNTYKIIEVDQDPDDEYYTHEPDGQKNFNMSPKGKTLSFKFKSENGTYFEVLYSTNSNAKKWDWELTFSNRRKDDGTYLKSHDILGGFETKEVIRILNTVIKTMKDMLDGHDAADLRMNSDRENYKKGKRKQYANTDFAPDVWEHAVDMYEVDSINFSAKVSEPSRVKLYKRMFSKFTSQLSSRRFKSSVEDKKDFVNFKIIKISVHELHRQRKEERKKREAEEAKKKESEEKEK